MLFILEGLDRTGKTTLARSQSRPDGYRYLHFSAPKQHPVEEYMRPLIPYLPGEGEDWWVDRHYLGELVWPQIFGRASRFDREMATFIELFLQSRGAMPLYAERDARELVRVCRNEPVAGHVTEARFRFAQETARSRLDWYPYRQGETDLVPTLLRARGQELLTQGPTRATWRWIGSPRPRVLLVGEQVNQPAESAGLPFIPYVGRSGHFLMKALNTDALRHREVALVNALDPLGNPEAVPALWLALGRPPIVALGKTAERVLSSSAPYKLPHRAAPHPQYWKRFKAKQGAEPYAQLIQEAAGL